MTAIDPSFVTRGVEWNVEMGDAPAAPTGTGFGEMLGKQLQSLESTQNKAADAARALADGTATDPAAAVVAVERARLAMQLASQLRTKGIEAVNDVMHTAV